MTDDNRQDKSTGRDRRKLKMEFKEGDAASPLVDMTAGSVIAGARELAKGADAIEKLGLSQYNQLMAESFQRSRELADQFETMNLGRGNLLRPETIQSIVQMSSPVDKSNEWLKVIAEGQSDAAQANRELISTLGGLVIEQQKQTQMTSHVVTIAVAESSRSAKNEKLQQVLILLTAVIAVLTLVMAWATWKAVF